MCRECASGASEGHIPILGMASLPPDGFTLITVLTSLNRQLFSCKPTGSRDDAGASTTSVVGAGCDHLLLYEALSPSTCCPWEALPRVWALRDGDCRLPLCALPTQCKSTSSQSSSTGL